MATLSRYLTKKLSIGEYLMAKMQASPKRKTSKIKPPEIVAAVELDGFDEFMNEHHLPKYLTHEILSEIYDGNDHLEELVIAIHAIDKFRPPESPDKKPLIALLRSRGTTAAENELIADVFDRVVLKWPVGARRLPSYMIAEDHHTLLNARGDVQELQAMGLSLAKAIERVSENLNIPYAKLEGVCRGQARFVRKQRKKIKKKTSRK
jgi:hypothetical protein